MQKYVAVFDKYLAQYSFPKKQKIDFGQKSKSKVALISTILKLETSTKLHSNLRKI